MSIFARISTTSSIPLGIPFVNPQEVDFSTTGTLAVPSIESLKKGIFRRRDKAFNVNLGMEYFLTETSSVTGSVFGRFSDEQDVTDNNSERYVAADVDSRTFRREQENEDDQNYQVSLKLYQ